MDSMSEFYGISEKDETAEEKELLDAFHTLNSAGKAMVLANAKALIKSGDNADDSEE